MEVVADLVVDVDGVTATVESSGTDITVRCADPARLLDAVSRAALPSAVGRIDGPRALGRAAVVLQRAGLHVTVAGPEGAVLELGRDTHSVLGAVVTGSSAVRPGSWVTIRPLVAASAGRLAARHRRGSAGLLLGALAAALAVRRLRRRTTGS